jgi:hypothetical protein
MSDNRITTGETIGTLEGLFLFVVVFPFLLLLFTFTITLGVFFGACLVVRFGAFLGAVFFLGGIIN